VSCDITMLQNVLDRSVVVQPERGQIFSRLAKYLESLLESIKNLYCSGRIALEMMSYCQCCPILSNL
jgi:hypothetical protein